MTPIQEQSIITAHKAGINHKTLAERFGCHRRVITRVLIKAGLMKAYSLWKPETVAELTELIKMNCHTAEELASILNNKFDTDYTREAICGKVHRLGLVNMFRKGAPKRLPSRVTPFMQPPVSRNIPIAPSSVDNADALNVTLMQLEVGMCKWPTGHDAYCGHPSGHRKPYCDKHQSAGSAPASGSRYARPSY